MATISFSRDFWCTENFFVKVPRWLFQIFDSLSGINTDSVTSAKIKINTKVIIKKASSRFINY
jgi:hypothetical protein